MTRPVTPMTPAELELVDRDDRRSAPVGLTTPEGALPLTDLSVAADIHGLTAHVHVRQAFVNRLDRAIEATYVHPLPDRAAVTGFRMTVADRVIDGVLKERGAARQEYDTAIAQGHRAAIAEENRPDVFAVRVGNIQPGETATVDLDLVGRLPVDDGVATFHHPLVVAPRYVPGTPLDGRNVGDGVADDTTAVPDASTISPPVLLPGMPNPVRLALRVTVDPAGLDVHDLRSSLHDVVVDEPTDGATGAFRVCLRPGERVDRDFILRFRVGGSDLRTSVVCAPDGDDVDTGTWMATVVPPEGNVPQPRDVVLVLDRSGSMSGWKMVAARRAAARIVDTLRAVDRFAVVAFDSVVDVPPDLDGLVPATDRNRFRAVEFLARLDARGGTEMLPALRRALGYLANAGERPATVVLVTDGQVANEDQILSDLDRTRRGARLFTVGIDRAVNAGFLRRLAAAGAGRCDLVESEDRLDEVMTQLHRRIAAPVLLDVEAVIDGVDLLPAATTPVHADCFAGVPLVITGRYRGRPGGIAVLAATDDLDGAWSSEVTCRIAEDAHLAPVWARAHLRDLEDRYAVTGGGQLAERIVETSLSFGVLSRFTAYVAVDRTEVTDSTAPTRVLQPVELPSGWQDTAMPPPAAPMAPMRTAAAAPSYIDMELGSPEAAPVPPPSSAAPSGFAAPPPMHASEVLYAANTADGRGPRMSLDGYTARRAAVAAEIGEAIGARDVTRVRRLLRELRRLHDDLASVGLAEPELSELQQLIDTLAGWVAAPSDAATAEVRAALDALGSMHGSVSPPRDRSSFWR